MSLEYDWTSNTYRSRLGDAFTPTDVGVRFRRLPPRAINCASSG